MSRPGTPRGCPGAAASWSMQGKKGAEENTGAGPCPGPPAAFSKMRCVIEINSVAEENTAS